jgi:pimeloyl-ACP methyl ester carboxylesterase
VDSGTGLDSGRRSCSTKEDCLCYPRESPAANPHESLKPEYFYAHGTDIGARVTSDLARFHADVVKAIHIGSVDLDWPQETPKDIDITSDEAEYIKRVQKWDREEGAYREIQATYPQTLAYALNDSPIGLASWIIEKYYKWGDCKGTIESRFTKDELITNVMIYWQTNTINSSMRRYYEVRKKKRITTPISTPTHIAMYPGEHELIVPESWVRRTYNVAEWINMESGGHFPASEEPEMFVNNIRDSFRRYRN